MIPLKYKFYILILSVFYIKSCSSIFKRPEHRVSHSYWPDETMSQISSHSVKQCKLPKEKIEEIAQYRDVFEAMRNKVLNGDFQNITWNEVVDYTFLYPKRMAGSPELEKGIEHLEQLFKNKFKFQKVTSQMVPVPDWTRGKESCTLLKPYEKDLSIFGLGTSVGTPKEGITGEAIIVKDFKDMEKKKDNIKGKIVVINFDYEGYGISSGYRIDGAMHASKYGAIACLIRSVSNYSLYTPHGGVNDYGNATTKIPAASITVEDAFLLNEMSKRKIKIEINLKMEAKTHPMKESRNIFGEITGSQHPDKFVILTGHIDGWDTGMGAFDDAGGVLLSAFSLHLINALELKPKRTMRAIAFTAEEVGYWGSNTYIKGKSVQEHQNCVAAFECDEGIFKPDGIDFAGNDEAFCIVKEIVKILTPIEAGITRQFPHVSSDIAHLMDCCGIPGFSVYSKGTVNEYFNYHHTKADHPVWMRPKYVDLSLLTYAFTAYVMADLSFEIPNGNGFPIKGHMGVGGGAAVKTNVKQNTDPNAKPSAISKPNDKAKADVRSEQTCDEC